MCEFSSPHPFIQSCSGGGANYIFHLQDLGLGGKEVAFQIQKLTVVVKLERKGRNDVL